MSNEEEKSGYKKPPKNHQFKKGQSGNPKGRPKKKSNFEEDVRTILQTRIPVVINGKKTHVTKLYALLEQVINGAINKNLTLMRLALPLLKLADAVPEFDIRPEDQKALRNLLKNLDQMETENDA